MKVLQCKCYEHYWKGLLAYKQEVLAGAPSLCTYWGKCLILKCFWSRICKIHYNLRCVREWSKQYKNLPCTFMHSCAYTVGILPHAIKQVSVVGLHVGSGYPRENSHYWLGTVPHYSLIFTTNVNSIDSENMSVIYLLWPPGLEHLTIIYYPPHLKINSNFNWARPYIMLIRILYTYICTFIMRMIY